MIFASTAGQLVLLSLDRFGSKGGQNEITPIIKHIVSILAFSWKQAEKEEDHDAAGKMR